MSNSLFSAPPANNKLQLDPFTVNVPQKDIDELEQLLRLSRFPPRTFENLAAGGRFGVTLEWMESMKREWLDKSRFDWRQQEQHINSFPQFTCSTLPSAAKGQHIHFAALFSPNPAAIPIVLLHGWPGSFLEFLPLLELVSKQHASDPQSLGYHLIVPSLPGYGFSSPHPAESIKDYTSSDTAKLIEELMRGLGFESYVAQGGDVGAKIARILGAEFSACKAVHLNMCGLPFPPPGFSLEDPSLTEKEKEYLERPKWFFENASGYAFEQETRPSTLGFVLSSNPIALLAWVGEKHLQWVDPTHPLSTTTILQSVSLYWFTNSISTSFYPYREPLRPAQCAHHPPWALTADKAAFGYSAFKWEMHSFPRKWIESTGDLRWFNSHEIGGHHAAWEQPELFWGDLDTFLKEAWVA